MGAQHLEARGEQVDLDAGSDAAFGAHRIASQRQVRFAGSARSGTLEQGRPRQARQFGPRQRQRLEQAAGPAQTLGAVARRSRKQPCALSHPAAQAERERRELSMPGIRSRAIHARAGDPFPRGDAIRRRDRANKRRRSGADLELAQLDVVDVGKSFERLIVPAHDLAQRAAQPELAFERRQFGDQHQVYVRVAEPRLHERRSGDVDAVDTRQLRERARGRPRAAAYQRCPKRCPAAVRPSQRSSRSPAALTPLLRGLSARAASWSAGACMRAPGKRRSLLTRARFFLRGLRIERRFHARLPKVRRGRARPARVRGRARPPAPAAQRRGDRAQRRWVRRARRVPGRDALLRSGARDGLDAERPAALFSRVRSRAARTARRRLHGLRAEPAHDVAEPLYLHLAALAEKAAFVVGNEGSGLSFWLKDQPSVVPLTIAQYGKVRV